MSLIRQFDNKLAILLQEAPSHPITSLGEMWRRNLSPYAKDAADRSIFRLFVMAADFAPPWAPLGEDVSLAMI